MDYDAVVVGGGPAGCAAATPLAAAGFRTLLLEEHRRIGHPIQCSGLVTQRVLELLGRSDDLVDNEVQGVLVHSPRGKVLTVDGGGPRAYVVDRAALDQAVEGQARSGGVEVRQGVRATAGERDDDGRVRLHLRAEGGPSSTITTRLVIGADGVQSSVARWFGLRRPRDLASAIEWRGPGLSLDRRMVAVFLGTQVAPGFFGWAIPHGNGNGAVGLGACGGGTPAVTLLGRLVGPGGHAAPYAASMERNHSLCGLIPLDLISRPLGDNVMTVGDAAGQVKPLSGGGIYTGLVCGKLCGEVGVKALQAEDVRARALMPYKRGLDAGIGKELRQAYRLRKVFRQLSDDQLCELLDLLDDQGLLHLVVVHGDIDYPTNLAARLLRSAPSLARFTRPFLRSLLPPTTSLAPT